MEECKKSDDEERKENDRSEEKPNNKEGTVDGEEGTGCTDIKENKDEAKEKPVSKSKNGEGVEREMPEDKEKEDGTVKDKIVEVKKADDGKMVKSKDKEGKEDETQRSANKEEKGEYKKKDVKEMEEDKLFKDATINWNGSEKSEEELQMASGKLYETDVQEVVNMGKEGLKTLSVEVLPFEEGNGQLKATHDQTASISKQDSLTNKQESCKHAATAHEIKLENGEAICGQPSSHVMPSKEQNKKTNEALKTVEAVTDKTEERDDTGKTMQRGCADHEKENKKEHKKISDNMNKELNKEETLIEMKEEEENTVINKDRKTDDNRTVSIHQKPVQEMTVVEGSVNTSLLSSAIHQIPQKKAKEQEKFSVTDESKQGLEVNVAQENKRENKIQEMSSRETIKNSLQNEVAAGKQEHEEKASEKEKNKSDNKLKERNNMKVLNDTEKGRKEENENVEQKNVNGDKRVLDSSYKSKNFVIKEVPESSTNKAADKVTDDTHQKHGAQVCSSQETAVKSEEEHTTKSSETLASTVTLPSKKSDEKDQSQGVHYRTLDMSTTEKPVHTVFQETVSRGAKCEESVQQSDITYSKQSQEGNKVKSGNSLLTETAINDQLKQLEHKVQQSPQQKIAHLKEQPLKQQTQQKQQKQKQQTQLQEQKEMQPKWQHPQKQHQQQKSPGQQMEQQKQEQQTQKEQEKEWKEQTQQKQQTQQPQKKNIQVNQTQEEKQSIQFVQKNQQQSMLKEKEIQKQKLEQQEKQRQEQRQEHSHEKLQEQKTKKQDQQQTKEEYNEKQKWQQEQKFRPQQLQSYEQEKERSSKEHQMDQENQANQQKHLQSVKQFQQKTIQQNQSKWQQQQEQPKKQQKPKEQEEKLKQQQEQLTQKQEPEQLTQQQEEEKPKQQQKQEEPNHEQQEQQSKQSSKEGEEDSAPGCGGMQGRSCPIYFGVKSYLHHFYDSAPVKNSQLYEDYIEEDDFEYAVDPMKNRGCRKCCRGFWFRAGLWGGINLILVGVITLLVGHLTPQREMIVGHHNNIEILDRTAIAFNRRLELCRLAGLAVFCCGGLVLLLTLLLSTFFHIGGHNNNNSHCCSENDYYDYVTTSLVEPFIPGQVQGSPVPAATGIKIPVTEQIKSVQPTLWPDIATIKDGAVVSHMP